MNQHGYDGGLGMARLPGGAEPLQRAEAMRLLASVDLGRVVFDMQALPAIRPVNHVVDDGVIIIRCRLSSALSAAVRSADHLVVAYEADALDSRTRTGWSVVATGRARTVTDPGLVARYEQRLHPWVNHADTVVAIEPEIVTGLRLNAP